MFVQVCSRGSPLDVVVGVFRALTLKISITLCTSCCLPLKLACKRAALDDNPNVNPEHFYDYNSLMQQAMMRQIVGTRAEASVAEQNHNCSPILSHSRQIFRSAIHPIRWHRRCPRTEAASMVVCLSFARALN